MDESGGWQPEKVGEQKLRPLVQQVLHSDRVESLTWTQQLLQGGIGGGVGGTAIYLFEGQAQDRGKRRPWSMILKVLDARRGEAPSSSHYWKREVEVYRSGWLERLPGPLVAPRCFGVEEHGAEGCWIWLEQVTESISGAWPLERYGVAADHLGQFSGAYANQRPLPSWPWLSANFIRGDLEQATPGLAMLRRSLTHPLVRRLLPGESGDAFFQLYDHRETFFRWLEQLPQTVCHFDAFRRNLIARQDGEGNEETVVIDWAFAGLGPVGAEIVALVWVSLVSRKEALASSVAGELDRIAFQGYMEGLGKTGWRGDPRQVRLAYTAAVALRRIGTLGFVAMFLLADQLAEPEATEPPDAEQLAFLDNLARIGPFVEDLAREAGQLAESLL